MIVLLPNLDAISLWLSKDKVLLISASDCKMRKTIVLSPKATGHDMQRGMNGFRNSFKNSACVLFLKAGY